MKTLIVAPSWVGDAIMSQPLLARLKGAGSDCIDILAPAWVLPVYRRMPEVNATLISPFGHGQNSLRERWRLAREIARHAYQKAVVLPNSLKSALIPCLAGIPQRVGFTGEARFGLLNDRHTLNKTALPLMVERFAQLAQAPGTPIKRPIAPPRLLSSTEQQAACLRKMGLERPNKLAVLCPGAEFGPAKRWPTEHFATLAKALHADGFEVWAIGSPKDQAVGEAIARMSQTACLNLCGITSLEQAIDILAMSDLVITNDSGLMHVAAAVNRPIVALFGSSSPGFTPPLSDQAHILSLQLSCSPCFKRECPLGHLDCLTQLLPEQVLHTCRAALEKY